MVLECNVCNVCMRWHVNWSRINYCNLYFIIFLAITIIQVVACSSLGSCVVVYLRTYVIHKCVPMHAQSHSKSFMMDRIRYDNPYLFI